MYSDTQLGAAHLVAAALGRALGIRVVIANVPTACTDGNTIYLPPLPVTVSTQLIAMLWGFIHHEAGHCRHSDFSVLQDLASEQDALLLNLARVFEDIRMERAHIALYPGAHRILCELVEVLVKIGFFKPPDPDHSPASLAVGLILKSLRSSLLGQTALSEQAQLHRELVEQALGRGSVIRLLAICQEVCDARSSEDALNLAYRVREYLEEEQKKADEPPPPSPEASKTSLDSASGGSQQSDPNGSDDADASGQVGVTTGTNMVKGSTPTTPTTPMIRCLLPRRTIPSSRIRRSRPTRAMTRRPIRRTARIARATRAPMVRQQTVLRLERTIRVTPRPMQARPRTIPPGRTFPSSSSPCSLASISPRKLRISAKPSPN